MAKIGTAQIEIKPVLNEDALAAIVAQIERAVRDAVAAGLAAGRLTPPGQYPPFGPIQPYPGTYPTFTCESGPAVDGEGPAR